MYQKKVMKASLIYIGAGLLKVPLHDVG